MTTLGTKLLIAGMIVGPLAIWGAIEGVKRDAVRTAKLKASEDSLRVAVEEKNKVVAQRDLIAAEKRRVRIAYVDRIVMPGRTAPVPIDSVREIVNRCTEEANACDSARAGSASLVNTLNDRIKNLEAQKGREKPPRLGVTADGFWDLLEQAPGARITALARVGGPLSLFVEGQAVVRSNRELRTTPSDSSRVRAQALVGARITFR